MTALSATSSRFAAASVMPSPSASAIGLGADSADSAAAAHPASHPAPALGDVCAFARAAADESVARLAALARIPSSSAQFERRAACARAARLVRAWALAAGAVDPELVSIGYQELASGERHDLPPVLLAEFGQHNPAKCTVLVYANYDIRDIPTDMVVPPGKQAPRAGDAAASHHHPQQRNDQSNTQPGPGMTDPASGRTANGLARVASRGIADGTSQLPDSEDTKLSGAVKSSPLVGVSKAGSNAKGASAQAKNSKDMLEDDAAAEIAFVEAKGALHGTGVSTVKGPLVAWLSAVEAYHKTGAELPVNLKLMVEGMKMSSSECLADLVKRESGRGGFLRDIDYVVTIDGSWPTSSRPSLTAGTRGLASFEIQVTGGSKSLDSGEFGGCIAEPMTDLIQLLAEVTKLGHGRIGVDGCGPESMPATPPEEISRLSAVKTDIATLKKAAGDAPALVGGNDKLAVLLNRSRMPAISIHGIEGAYDGPGVNTVIPGAVSGKFTIRLGPGQEAEKVTKLVTDALEARFKSLNSPNDIRVSGVSFNSWEADTSSLLYMAATSAAFKVHGVTPDLVRSGSSLLAIDCFMEIMKRPSLVFPIGGLSVPSASSSGLSNVVSDDDPIMREHFVSGIVMLVTLLDEIARMDLPTHAGQARARKHSTFSIGKDVARISAGPLSRIRDIWNGLA
jgi:acetylornithine deacetylase/succinyl-diaminopimelate desuccinylase-like protein